MNSRRTSRVEKICTYRTCSTVLEQKTEFQTLRTVSRQVAPSQCSQVRNTKQKKWMSTNILITGRKDEKLIFSLWTTDVITKGASFRTKNFSLLGYWHTTQLSTSKSDLSLVLLRNISGSNRHFGRILHDTIRKDKSPDQFLNRLPLLAIRCRS